MENDFHGDGREPRMYYYYYLDGAGGCEEWLSSHCGSDSVININLIYTSFRFALSCFILFQFSLHQVLSPHLQTIFYPLPAIAVPLREPIVSFLPDWRTSIDSIDVKLKKKSDEMVTNNLPYQLFFFLFDSIFLGFVSIYNYYSIYFQFLSSLALVH